MPSTDPMAATVAEIAIRDILERQADVARQDPQSTARAIVDQFYASFEHEDGKRRVVLTGPLEIVPTASMQPLFTTVGQG
jgi:hypothetical protein